MTAVVLAAVLALIGVAEARSPHVPHPPRQPPGHGGGGTGGAPGGTHMAPLRTLELPGRGLTIAWSPAGDALAVGGHFRDGATGQRYDTKVYNAASGALTKSFDCHYFWVIATTWTRNPFVGDVIASGGGDHAVKLWDADAPGSQTCHPGQFRATEGGIQALYQNNGWMTALAFSPDGRFLAGANKDRTIRIWQVEPGAEQWRVVALWYDGGAGNFVSVGWAPDGRQLVTGDRHGRVAMWDFDPAADRWDSSTIAAFGRLSSAAQAGWFGANPALVTKAPRWSEGGHRVVWHARFSPDGTRVAATGADGLLSVFDASSGAIAFRAGARVVTALHGLDWSPDGRTLAAGGADHRIHLFDAATGAVVDTITGHADVVTAVAWSPDGRTLASTAGGPLLSFGLVDAVAGPDQSVRLWSWRQ